MLPKRTEYRFEFAIRKFIIDDSGVVVESKDLLSKSIGVDLVQVQHFVSFCVKEGIGVNV